MQTQISQINLACGGGCVVFEFGDTDICFRAEINVPRYVGTLKLFKDGQITHEYRVNEQIESFPLKLWEAADNYEFVEDKDD